MSGRAKHTATPVSPRARRVGSLLAVASLAAGAVAIAPSGAALASPVRAAAFQSPPNVVVIETDDQTLESMRVMDSVGSLIAARGASFANSFVNFSLCCPSRATFLTGQYAQNSGVRGNSGPTGGFRTFERLHPRNNLAVWLKRGGYHTALIGKYLNGYGSADPTLVPPGWSEWYAAVGASTLSVYDYDLNENGTLVHYGTDPADFKQDVLTAKAVDFIGRQAPAAKPFFLWLTYTSPHLGRPDPSPQPPFDCDSAAKPAPRHAGVFDSEPVPTPPSFNEEDVFDKPQAIQDLPLLDSAVIDDIARRYRCELESLLAVDEGVAQVVDELKQQAELARTYVIFTSDNGFFHGEHRVPRGKVKLYEESIRVPLAIRGPGIPHGEIVRDLAINADLAPTIVDATGARPRLVMDGRSLLPFTRRPGVERGRELSIEGRNTGGVNAYNAIRTQRYIYAQYRTGEKELYDLKRDPYELQSRDADPAYRATRRRLARRLGRLEHCSGKTCRLRPRLSLELHYRSDRSHGHRCARAPIRAEVAGGNASGVVKAEFYVDRQRVAVDIRAPFRRRLPYRSFNRDARTRVRVRASMLDGRRMTIDRSVRACR